MLADVALVARPPLPVSEARYLGVAWEMWRTGDWLVPRLNGQPYPDKPPLLLWIVVAGWRLGGVGETWARLVVPAFGAGTLALTAVLARLLWPEAVRPRAVVPLLLVAMPVFLLFATTAFFDVPLAFFVVLALVGLVLAQRGRTLGFALAGAALGFGILTKGPVALLHVVPVALLAPLWAGRRAVSWTRWYAGIVAVLALAAMIALAWALPAAARGGAAYAEAILWGQTGGRLAASFAHAEPWWWYLPWLPVLGFPWAWWPPLWRALRAQGRSIAADPGARLCVVWFAVPFAGFMLISGKQPQYLVPLLPALALLAARLTVEEAPARRDSWPALGALAAVAAIALLGPWLAPFVLGAAFAELSALGPGVLAVGLAGLWAVRWRTRDQAAAQLVGAVALAYVAAHVAFAADLRPRFDVAPTARFLAQAEAAGQAIAHPLGYEGHFQFAGRLTVPLAEVAEPEMAAWAAAHPDGFVISYPRAHDRLPVPASLQPFRGRWLAVWPAAAVLEHGYAALKGE